MSGTQILTRHLSLRDLIVYGLLFIGPLAPVGVFGVLDARTGGAVPLVYLLSTIAVGFTAWSYAQMSRVVPRAGSVFAYASEGIGPRTGFLAGWLAMLDYLLIPSVAYLFSGIALHALVPIVPAWIFTVLAFAATTALNRAGVAVAARVGTVVLAAELAVLVLFVACAVAVLVHDGPVRPWLAPLLGAGTVRVGPVVGAISIAVLSFLGFDAIASFAEESAGDVRHVGTAIGACLVVAGVIFVVQSWLAALISPLDPAELAAHPERQGAAFYEVARLAIGPWMSHVLALTKAVGPAFAAMTAQAAAARLLFGMAREGRLPVILAGVDARRGVPTAALTTVAALTLLVSAWAARRDDGLDVLVSIVDLGALSAFTLLHASVVGFFVVRRRGASRAAHWLVPVAGAATTIWVIVETSALAKIVAGAWLLAGLLAMQYRSRPSPGLRADGSLDSSRLSHAGGVVYRVVGDTCQVLLVRAKPAPHDWVLPKGHIERGETPEACARREVQEEAGVQSEVVTWLGVDQFTTPQGKAVTAAFFLLRYVGDAVALDPRERRWVSFDEAATLSPFTGTVRIIQAARLHVEARRSSSSAW